MTDLHTDDPSLPSEDLSAEVTDAKFEALVARLNRQSVEKHFEAYVDIPWDDPDYQIDPTDPRWELDPDKGLGATDWYRSQPPEVRAGIGLHDLAAKMKTGLQFESILKRGLLEYAAKLPNNAPEFRYAYHEVIEEAHHALMFQEFVNRSGIDVGGMPWHAKLGSRRVISHGRRFPELFFIFVLGGEDPIDSVQRDALRSERDLHPLIERIMRIHVTEEARHLSFARNYLKERNKTLNPLKRFILSIAAPITLATMAQLMLKPPSSLIREYGVPRSVVREAYTRNPEYKKSASHALRKVRQLCKELGAVNVVTRPIWKLANIWD